MKHNYKRTAIVAIILILFGCLIYGITVAATGADIGSLNTMEYKQVTHTVTDAFTSIDIDAVECDVRLVLSENGSYTVSSGESEYIRSFVEVKDGTLYVKRVDTRPWYMYFGIFIMKDDYHMTVSIPDTLYEEIRIKTASGNITLDDTFSMDALHIKSSSGDILCSANPKDTCSVQTVSGEIRVQNISSGEIRLQSTSGDIEAENLTSETTVDVQSTSGEIELEGVIAAHISVSSTSGDIGAMPASAVSQMILKSVSGKIGFAIHDTGYVSAETTSGNISGVVIDGSMFYNTKTVSGSVRVPHSDKNGAECRLVTVSGNIVVQDKTGIGAQ